MADSITNSSSATVQRYKASLVEVVFGEATVRVIFHLETLFFRLLDLNRMFGYKSARTAAVRNALERRGHDYLGGITRVSEGKNSAIYLSEELLGIFCQINVSGRADALRQWLDDGGPQRLKAEWDAANPRAMDAAKEQPHALSPLEPVRLHLRALNELSLCMEEMRSERTSYATVSIRLSIAVKAVHSLSGFEGLQAAALRGNNHG